MGTGMPQLFVSHCPWAQIAADPRLGRWLSTFWFVKELGQWPPGRHDPQLLDALAIIAGEHATILREEADKARSGTHER
jgi:hypothetical protein